MADAAFTEIRSKRIMIAPTGDSIEIRGIKKALIVFLLYRNRHREKLQKTRHTAKLEKPQDIEPSGTLLVDRNDSPVEKLGGIESEILEFHAAKRIDETAKPPVPFADVLAAEIKPMAVKTLAAYPPSGMEVSLIQVDRNPLPVEIVR
jgi:hypothetical protein